MEKMKHEYMEMWRALKAVQSLMVEGRLIAHNEAGGVDVGETTKIVVKVSNAIALVESGLEFNQKPEETKYNWKSEGPGGCDAHNIEHPCGKCLGAKP